MLKGNNLLSNQSSSRPEDVTVRPALTILKLGLRHVVSIVSIWGFWLMKHHCVMSKKSPSVWRTACAHSKSPAKPVSLRPCGPVLTDPTGRNIRHSLAFLEHNSANVCIPGKMCLSATHLLCCEGSSHSPLPAPEWLVGHLGPGSRFFPSAKRGGFCCPQPTKALFHLSVVARRQELAVKKKWEKHLDPHKMPLLNTPEALKRSLGCFEMVLSY